MVTESDSKIMTILEQPMMKNLKNLMRHNTLKLTQNLMPKPAIWAALFEPMCHPNCCQHDVFLRPGARNLPMGGPRYDLHDMLAEFGCNFADIWHL